MPASSSTINNPGGISFWFRQIEEQDAHAFEPRATLTESIEADVCIVGAGYSGLYTAYYLLTEAPGTSVVLLDAEIAGYGASGRNGGAVIAQFNGSRAYWQKRGGRDGLLALEAAVRGAVDSVGELVAAEGIDCAFAKNGVLMAARTALEAERFKRSVEVDREFGWTEADSRYVGAEELRGRINVDGAVGARWNAHCASIHPGRLVRGLADAVERHGGVIYEGTRVVAISPGRAVTDTGLEVRARTVIRATEAYSDSIASERRMFVPIYTSMLVTEPLDEAMLQAIGWEGREALLAEHPFLHLQHTADHRITIGGDDNRVPYRWGSAPSPDTPPPTRVFDHYRAELTRLFPALRDVRIDHSWQGVFAATRQWAPSVGLDRETGIGWAGGYVGEGVANSNLAAHTLAHLIQGRDSEYTRLPLVVRRPHRRWEPEPLRYLGALGISRLRERGDTAERATGRPSKLWALADKAAGYTGHIG